MKINDVDLINFLKKEISKKNISQKEISKRIDLSATKFSLMFNLKRKMTAEEFILICYVCNIDFDKIKKELIPYEQL